MRSLKTRFHCVDTPNDTALKRAGGTCLWIKMNISTKLNPAPRARVGRSVLTHSWGPPVCFAVAFSVAQKTNESTALLPLLCSVSDEHARGLIWNMA